MKAVDSREDKLRYLYLPRLQDRGVLAQAIVKGDGTRDFFGTAHGQRAETLEGFKFGDANVQLDDTPLLIEPDAAKAYEAAHPSVSDTPPVSPEPRHPNPPGNCLKRRNTGKGLLEIGIDPRGTNSRHRVINV